MNKTEDNFKLDRYINNEIKTLFKEVLKTVIKEPLLAKFFIQTYRWQKKNFKTRVFFGEY